MTKPPNILLVITDQQQGATVDPESPCVTPNARRLAREGLRFTRGYTPVGLTGPAHASLMTGVYPSRHGMLNNYWTQGAIRPDLEPSLKTYPENLREAGYSLSTTGKWAETKTRTAEDFGFFIKNGAVIEMRKGRKKIPRPITKGIRIERPGWPVYILCGISSEEPEMDGDWRVMSGTVEEIERLAEAGQPWMIRAKFNAPHDSFIGYDPYVAQYKLDEIQLPANFEDDLKTKPNILRRQYEELWKSLSREDYRMALMCYWAFTTFVDDMLGRILDALDRTGQADDTLVIFTSDHGDMATSHKLFLKGVAPYEETYRVPFILRWPKGIGAPGRTCDAFASWLDLTATMIDVAGAQPLTPCSGRSLKPFFESSDIPAGWRNEFYGQFTGTELYYTQRILNNGKHKFIFNGFDFDELYDLENDPFEMNNLALDPAYDSVRQMMIERMWARIAEEDEDFGHYYPTVALTRWGPGLRTW